jgi:hypothetical protein
VLLGQLKAGNSVFHELYIVCTKFQAVAEHVNQHLTVAATDWSISTQHIDKQDQLGECQIVWQYFGQQGVVAMRRIQEFSKSTLFGLATLHLHNFHRVFESTAPSRPLLLSSQSACPGAFRLLAGCSQHGIGSGLSLATSSSRRLWIDTTTSDNQATS